MNKKIFILILISLFFQNLIAQKVSNEEQRKIISEMLYQINTGFLKSEKQKFKTIEYNPNDFFSKSFPITEADSCFKLMSETAKIEFKKNRLYFVTDVLNTLNNNDLRSSLIEIFIFKNKLFYDKDSLKLRGQGGGNRITDEHYQITRNYPLKSEQSDIKKIDGSLIMKVDFVIGYDIVSVKKNDLKSKKIQIGKDTIQVIDIIENKVVLKGKTENINLINFIKKNKIAIPLDLNDEGYDSEKQLSFSSITIYKSNYENFVQKKVSKNEFDKLMTIDKLNEIQNEEQYKIIKNVTTIGDTFILYKPKYKIYYLTVEIK
jgi:hypothetical protein